jgi:hypothetical protein
MTDDIRPMLIRPSGLGENPSEVTVAGFCDAAALHSIAGSVFTGDQAAVPHQLRRSREARQRPDFGDDAGSGRLGDAANGL